MSRGLLPLLAGIALVVVLVASVATGFAVPHARQSAALAQAETPTATPAAGTPTTGTPGPGRAAARAQLYPPELAFLAQMTPQQRFDHMLPGQMAFVNPQGQEVIVNSTPGQVSAVGGNSVTVTVNGPAPAQTRTFNITPTTWVHAMPHRGSIQALATGDRVVVYTIGNSGDATAIMESRASMFHMGMMGGGYHMTGEQG